MRADVMVLILVMITSYQLLGQDHVDLIGFETQTQSKVTRISLEGKLPIILSSKSVMIIGGQYHQWLILDDTLELTKAPFSRLKQKIGFIGWKQKVSPKSSLLFIGMVRSSHLNADRFNPSRFQFGGVVTWTIDAKDNLKFTLGSYLNTEKYSLFWVPMIGLDWSINENWRIYGNLPINLTVQRKVGDKVRAGLYFKGTITSYYNETLVGPSYVDQSDNSLTIYGELYLTKNIVLRPSMGVSVGRSYKLYDGADQLDFRVSAIKIGDSRQPLHEFDVKGTSPVIGLNLIFRVPKPKY